MKIGGKNGLTRNQFRTLIFNLQEIAREFRTIKQEREKEQENKEKENKK